ncbi:MAG: ThiF family adenylyltransferase [Clostridia bacterium]
MKNWLNRTEYLIGKDNLNKLNGAHIAVFGCGGVGSYAIEALARSGIGNLTLIDNDVVDITNINRQLIADTTTVGMPKVEVEKERLLKINPNLNITIYQEFYDATNSDKILNTTFDYIIDAIDSVSSKLCLIEEAYKKNIPIISSMGTGNKLDPTKFEVSDISKTSVCPLAKVVRKELRNRNINHLKVVYSKEEPVRFDTSDKKTPASIAFVPSVAGLILASEVVKDLCSKLTYL